jgi:hypothetical protein
MDTENTRGYSYPACTFLWATCAESWLITRLRVRHLPRLLISVPSSYSLNQPHKIPMPRIFHPAFGHEINVDATPLSEDPDTQVAQVIDMMVTYSDVDSNAPEIRADALRACAMANGDCIRGNFDDVKRSIRFVQDEDTGEPFTAWLKQAHDGDGIPEVLVRPVDMRRMADPQGDCDCFATTMRARLLSLGIPAGFVTVAVDPDDPGRFSHVYNFADCSGGACGPMWNGRVPLDTSHGAYPGWEAPNPYHKRAEWPQSGWKIAASILLISAIAWWVLK